MYVIANWQPIEISWNKTAPALLAPCWHTVAPNQDWTSNSYHIPSIIHQLVSLIRLQDYQAMARCCRKLQLSNIMALAHHDYIATSSLFCILCTKRNCANLMKRFSDVSSHQTGANFVRISPHELWDAHASP